MKPTLKRHNRASWSQRIKNAKYAKAHKLNWFKTEDFYDDSTNQWIAPTSDV